ERVDRKVAPQRVFSVRAVNVVGQQAAMLIGGVAANLGRAKCRDFDDFGADMRVNETKPPANDECATKQRLYLFRRGIRRQIEILGIDSQQKVAYGAADDVGVEAFVLELADHRARCVGQT